MPASPFLRVGLNQSAWKQSGGSALGWWVIDSRHWFFSKEGPYAGVLHAEILPSFNEFEAVFNLSVDTGFDKSVYSIGFLQQGFNVIISSSEGKDSLNKVTKIILELVHHLPDDKLREKIQSSLGFAALGGAGGEKTLLWRKI